MSSSVDFQADPAASVNYWLTRADPISTPPSGLCRSRPTRESHFILLKIASATGGGKLSRTVWGAFLMELASW